MFFHVYYTGSRDQPKQPPIQEVVGFCSLQIWQPQPKADHLLVPASKILICAIVYLFVQCITVSVSRQKRNFTRT